MLDEEIYPGGKNQNIDLVSGQHQVVRMSGANRHTTTTIFENQSANNPFGNDHQMSSATIPDNQLIQTGHQRIGNASGSRANEKRLLADEHTVLTGDASALGAPMGHVYPTHTSIVHQETNKGTESQPTKGVIDLGSVRRNPKDTSASIDEDDDGAAVLITHNSKNDLPAVNRFNSSNEGNNTNK